jgi:hypothetical protein
VEEVVEVEVGKDEVEGEVDGDGKSRSFLSRFLALK